MKYINKKILFALAVFTIITVHSQQDFQFSLYRQNMNAITPATAGMNDSFEIFISSRTKWAGVKGGPQTYNFNVNSPVGKNLGLGLTLVSDKVNITKQTYAYLDLSYKIKASENINIYGGLKVGGSFLNIDFDRLGVSDDPLLANNIDEFNPNFGFGFYLDAPKYYITLSMPRLLSKGLYREDNESVSLSQIPLYVGGGYDFDLSNNFMIKSSVLSSVVKGAPITMNVTASGLYKNRYELGLNYRIDESVSFFTMFNFPKNSLSFGYAYEQPITDISMVSNGTHEIVLRFSFK